MIDQLMRSIPIDQLSTALGEDEATTGRAVQAALPALLGGLASNSQNPDGAASLLGALDKHQDGLSDNFSLDRVDTNDGEKILGHVFGDNTDGVVNQLGGIGGGQMGPLVRKLLPILAPLVLSWLAKQVGGAGGAGRGGLQPDGPRGGAGRDGAGGADMTSVLQDVLGSALGGATGQSPTSGGGGVLGDVLGGILGGRR